MNVMSELYGRQDKWAFTERDMRNRYNQSYNGHLVSFVNWYCVAFDLLCIFNGAIHVCTKAKFMREERSDDIPKVLEFFQCCKSANEYFYWDARIDGRTDALKNIFWSHASQRAECRDFGDVITYDTMHKTNKHRMSLAIFDGLNHQLLNVVFDQALLRDESSDSFECLFRTFKTCMGEPEPLVLLPGTCCFCVQCIS
jgi:hypothetical protein